MFSKFKSSAFTIFPSLSDHQHQLKKFLICSQQAQFQLARVRVRVRMRDSRHGWKLKFTFTQTIKKIRNMYGRFSQWKCITTSHISSNPGPACRGLWFYSLQNPWPGKRCSQLHSLLLMGFFHPRASLSINTVQTCRSFPSHWWTVCREMVQTF